MIVFVVVILLIGFISLECDAKPKSSIYIGAIANLFTAEDSPYIDAILLRSILLMAVNEINNKNDGISDRLLPNSVVRLAFSDPKHSYFDAISATQYLISNAFNNTGTDVCIGSSSFSIAKAMGEVLPQFSTMQFSYNDNSRFTFSSDFPNLFRTTNAVDFQGRGLASLCNHFGWKMVSVFASNDYFGSCALTEFQLRASELGMTILSAQQFIQHDTSLDDIIERAAASYASIFVILADSLDTSNLLQAGYNAGLFIEGTQVLGTSLAATDATWKSMSSNAHAIFKGFIGLKPTVDLTNPTLLAFAKRVSSLKPTLKTTSDGKKVCSDLMDDNRGYVYKGKLNSGTTTSSYTCAGISNYSHYSNPNSFDSSLFYAYDAIYAAFHGLHTHLYVYGKNTLKSTSFQSTLRSNVSFEGVTGNISFSSGLLGLSTFSAGSRRIGAYYQIVNYQLCETNITTKTTTTTTTTVLCAKNIGAWHGELGFKDCKLAGFSNCAEVVYNTADNSRPLDTPETIKIATPVYSTITLWVMAAVIIVIVAFFAIMVFVNRELAIIKHSQPILLFCILIGSLLGASRIIIAIYQPTNVFCKSSMWVSHLSYIMVFGALFLKSWRIHCRVNPPLTLLTNNCINGTLCSMIIIISIYLSIVMWGVHSPPNASHIITYEHRVASEEAICHLDQSVYSTSLFCFEGLLLLLGARVCWLINGVVDEVDEAKYVAPAIIGIAFICLVDFPAVYFLSLNPSSIRLVSSVGFFLAIIWTLAAQFGPKAYRIYNGDGDHLSDIVSNNILNKKHAISPTFALKDANHDELSSNAINVPNLTGLNQQQQQQEIQPNQQQIVQKEEYKENSI